MLFLTTITGDTAEIKPGSDWHKSVTSVNEPGLFIVGQTKQKLGNKATRIYHMAASQSGQYNIV